MGGYRLVVPWRQRAGWTVVLTWAAASTGCPSTDANKQQAVDGGAPLCPASEPSQCFDRGVSWLDRDPEKAARAFSLACDAGIGGACNNLGALYAEGRGVPRDASRAAALYERACTAGAAHGCHSLAIIVAEGKLGKPDLAKAFTLASKACALGHAHACDRVAVSYANGQGVT
ncbi:MAG: hypothetical protein DRI90_16755, partial [Deltaproteobacteria bacterium]